MGSHSPSAHPGASQRNELEALWKRSIEKFLPFHKKHGARAMPHPSNESPEKRGHEKRVRGKQKEIDSAGLIRTRDRGRGSTADR